MIIECPYCENHVDAEVVGKHESVPEQIGVPYGIILVECPDCGVASLFSREYEQVSRDGDWDWGKPIQLWPNPPKYYKSNLPDIVRRSLEEANKCCKAKAYDACAVMCGRALEGICKAYKTKKKALGGGLKELRESGVIDGRLYEWSDELRLQRNVGAHASAIKVSKADAQDLLEFSEAICDYVFVLSKRFEEFKSRKQASKVK